MRGLDLSVLELAAFAVSRGGQRTRDLGGEPVGLLQDRLDLVRSPGVERGLLEELAELELLEEYELVVPEVRPVTIHGAAHRELLSNGAHDAGRHYSYLGSGMEVSQPGVQLHALRY